MLTGRAVTQFRKKLLGWFRQFQRDLPWRRTEYPYRIWLSEIMLQQTRVAAVIPYYQRFLERFPDVKTLAEAPEEEVLRMWAGLGYYSRARNLQKAARQVVEKYGGVFPETTEEALALPGIGSYTAAAILSIAYGKKLAVLDGNVARVLARLAAIRGDLRAPERWLRLQETAHALLDRNSPGDWNQAMMELGATTCTPRSPQCLLCPVARFCQARKLGLQERIPEKREKRATVEVTLAALIFLDPRGRTLLLPPPKGKTKSSTHEEMHALLSRLWHFPTIAVHRHAAAELRAHVEKTLLGGRKLPGDLLALKKVRHAVTYRSLTVLPFCSKVSRLPRVAGSRRLPLCDLTPLAISNLTRKVARAGTAEGMDGKVG